MSFARPFPFAFALFLLLGWACRSGAQASASVADFDAIQHAVSRAVSARDYAALDHMEAELRSSRAMQPNGVWGLRTFYGSVERQLRSESPVAAAQAENFVRGWIKASPDSLAAPVVLGSLYTAHAFLLRGGSYAADVSPQQWAGYKQYQALAAAAFSMHPREQQRNPAWYSARLTTATTDVLDPPAFAALLEQSLVIAPDYNEPLRAVVHYSARQWGGSPELLEQIAKIALKIAGPPAYTVLYTEAYRQTDCRCEYKAHELHVQWPVFEQGAMTRLRTLHGSYFPNMYAAIACNAGHDQMMNALKPSIIEVGKMPYAWREFEQDPRCTRWMTELQTTTVTP